MAIQTLDRVDVSGKRVLMRVDFNVPLEKGAVADDLRIVAALPAIDSVLSRGGSVVLISHLGRPEGTGVEEKYSLRPVAARLAELRPAAKVSFPSADCVDAAAAAAVAALRPGEVLLLENLRFHGGEKRGDPAFAAKLAAYGDIYCNDAFGTAHRPDASMVAVPKAMAPKPRVMGPLMAKEVNYLRDAVAHAKRPVAVVLGGAKVSDKIGVIEHCIDRVDFILVGGAMAYTFLKALGRRVGSSRVEEGKVKDAHAMIQRLAESPTKGMLPIDHVCGKELAEGTPVKVFDEQIEDGWMGLDIGPRSVIRFAEPLREAGTIVWNGPLGAFETRPFDAGTRLIAEVIARQTQRGATTIIGGGDTAAAVESFGLADQFSHVSTGGGASLELLEGREFESLKVLDQV
ncbi:MAG TPA: phosphoglycerate kinase [Phycisphaerales bacterium]|nr:phosphoglycerate kinase [Phycisphaerales bacterium]HMP37752.1 phosphoglycerate kinase [Phycisphaerales bacterium]